MRTRANRALRSSAPSPRNGRHWPSNWRRSSVAIRATTAAGHCDEVFSRVRGISHPYAKTHFAWLLIDARGEITRLGLARIKIWTNAYPYAGAFNRRRVRQADKCDHKCQRQWSSRGHETRSADALGRAARETPNLVDKFGYSPLLLSMRKMPLTTMS